MRAVNYYEHIVTTPTDRTRDGWRRVGRVKEITPGDVVVWLRPESERETNRNTGHTMVAVGRPKRVPWLENAYTLRIADASSRGHGDDRRTETGTNGFGHGHPLFADRDGKPKASGGSLPVARVLTSKMAIGRPMN